MRECQVVISFTTERERLKIGRGRGQRASTSWFPAARRFGVGASG
jgi:hypothetical protein